MRTNQADFIEKCLKMHGNNYDYSNTKYVSASKKLTVTCKIHGDFTVKPYQHLNKMCGCPKCYQDKCINTTHKFIAKAIEKHGNRYSYAESDFIDLKTPIKITCRIHGPFLQRQRNHLNGAGCQKCARESCLSNTKDFIKRSEIAHGELYDYSKANYLGSFQNITIICKEHGEFQQSPSNHLAGSKCPNCVFDASRNDINHFIVKSIEKHGNKYDYSKSIYTKAVDKISIICPTHGSFEQKANNHMQGQGCPSCPITISSQHQEIIEYINSLGVIAIPNDRNILSGMEIDILCQTNNFGVEYHGLYWHSYNQLETKEQILRHQTKQIAAYKNNINLLQIFGHEWKHKKEIIKSMIKHRLNLSLKLHGRKLVVKHDLDTADFFDKNHLQGHRHASNNICLCDDNEIIMAASFSKDNKSKGYELIRMATKIGYYVNGGVSKIMACLITKTNDAPLLTYADLRYSNAKGYIASGFKLTGITKPGYFYYKDDLILSRQKCQKHKLEKLLPNFNPKLSEPLNMFNNGFRRVWDAGHYKLFLARESEPTIAEYYSTII